MSYIKFPMPAGQVGIKFGQISFEIIQTDRNKRYMFDGDGNLKSLGVAKVIHSGYINNCINKDMEAAYEVEDFSRQLSTMTSAEDVELVTAVIKAWADSTEMKDLIEKSKGEEKKSLTPGNTASESEPSPTSDLESPPAT